MNESFSLRLAPQVRSRLTRRAGRTGIQPRTLAQRYVDEGIRHDDHPLVHFLAGGSGRRAILLGTGLEVWEVIATVRDNQGDQDATAAYLDVSLGAVEAAINYYGEYATEIDAEIDDNEAEYEHGLRIAEMGRQALHR